MDKTMPILIYVAGLGTDKNNSADAVADVIANAMDTRDQPTQYEAKLASKVTAPPGLKASKGVYQLGTETCVLQLFELDYKGLLDGSGNTVGPTVPPGIVRSTQYAVFGTAMLVRALPRKSKRWATKLQLGLGFLGAAALIFAWLTTAFAALVAAGVDFPGFLGEILGEEAAGWVFGISGTAAVLSWAALRKSILAFAATIGHLTDYVRNDQGTRDAVSRSIDQAVNALRDNDWAGDIHLLAYSFGSLACFDAAFPEPAAMLQKAPFQHIASMVLVGCPLDLVRLYLPAYANGREARKADLPWKNVFNAADIFASNLKDEGDVAADGQVAEMLRPYGKVTSIRYTSQELNFFQIFMARGFRTHAGYWGAPRSGSCFGEIINDWAPASKAAAQPIAPAPAAQPAVAITQPDPAAPPAQPADQPGP